MDRIVVIGAGIMGRRIALHFLRAGSQVALVDPQDHALEAARTLVGPGLETAVSAAALDPAWHAPDVVIEAVPEILALKHAVIADLESVFPAETLIASNTSGLSTAQVSTGMRHPERFAIAHFFNPADLIPAVEVVPGPQTRPELIDGLVDLLARSGKRPARLAADIPGFIANRIQHAMMRECFHLLEEGVADAATIDDVVRFSLGVRLALTGPFAQRDLNGLDTHLSIAEYLYPALAADTDPPGVLRSKVEAGHLGRKSGRGFFEWDARREASAARTEAALADVVATASRLKEE